eukprot:COSAG02_NODE_529_length_20702_cov_43.720555_13_plen_88_part_00
MPGLQAGVTHAWRVCCLIGVQYHEIEKIADHPVPWPYTHLTQFFLVIWTYSLPACLVPTYGYAGEEATSSTPSLQSAHLLGFACSRC